MQVEVTLPGVSASTCWRLPLPLLCHQTSSRLSKSTVGKSCCSSEGCRPTSDDSQMRSLHIGSTTVGHKVLPKAISAVCRARLSGDAIRTSGNGDKAFASTRASVAWACPSSVSLVSYLPLHASLVQQKVAHAHSSQGDDDVQIAICARTAKGLDSLILG